MNKFSKSLVFILLATFSINSQATENSSDYQHQAKKTSKVYSKAHFGYSITGQSSTGFKESGGSIVLLDLLWKLSPKWKGGLRTIASGSQEGSSEFYRLSTGPTAEYSITPKWGVHFAFGIFSESAERDSDPDYNSKGQFSMIGWERVLYKNKKTTIAWGGFYSYYQGDVDITANTSLASSSFKTKKNKGSEKAITLSALFSL